MEIMNDEKRDQAESQASQSGDAGGQGEGKAQPTQAEPDQAEPTQAEPTQAEPAAPADAAAEVVDAAAGEARAEEDAAALKDQLLRALAEAENARRRAKKDVADAGKFAIAGLARDLLTVADNLGRALENISEAARQENEMLQTLAEGVEMTAKELAGAFEQHGIRRIDPLGEKFDYNLHQAMFEKEDPDHPDGSVVQVLQTGYTIGDRLLRPAMVGVAKGGAKMAAQPAAGETAETAETAETTETAETDDESGAPEETDGEDLGGRIDTSA